MWEITQTFSSFCTQRSDWRRRGFFYRYSKSNSVWVKSVGVTKSE